MDYTSEFTGPQIDERLRLAGTAYQRPETGIPAEDLSEGVQEALDKADNAYIMPEGGIPAEDIADGVIPQDVAHKVSGATSGNFAALNAQGDLEDSGKKASDFGSAADVEAINEKIPTQASESNQLADKNFVNSSIQTETAHFKGNYDSVADLPLTGAEYGGTPTNNDYMVIRDTTGKLTHEPSPLYDETGAYMAGEVRIVNDGAGNAEFYLCIADNDYNDPQPPATSPAYWEWLEDWETVNPGGTWRFKYSGVWSVNGVRGWRPEYQVNEEPLTAAQVAALNSNITEALTNKLVALPAKPVDTAAQVLSDTEKAQARTNIGATAPEVFWATYGTTTASEIDAAVAAGKIVIARNGNKYAFYIDRDTVTVKFMNVGSCGRLETWICRYSNNAWDVLVYNAQGKSNLVTSWQATPDNTHYPAEKLVYDSLGKRGVIRQTQTWTLAADGGYDYAMSGLVFGLIPQANIDLFESAGATFNETTGYFELNGLTDLSYEEMQKVMRYDLQNQAPVGNYKLHARTNLAPDVTRYYQNYYTWSTYAFNHNDSTCEILNLGAEGEENISWKRFFYVNDNGSTLFMTNNHHVKSVYGVINLENVVNINAGFFQNCENLERILLYGVKANLSSLAGSLRLSLTSIVFMVEHSKNTSAITITLHAAAYARCVADTMEYTYQGNTYTGIVAYANAKQITIASA